MHCPATKGTTLQVLWECSSHPETKKKSTKTNKKTPADKEHDQTLAPKQAVQEGWLKKVLLHRRKTTPVVKPVVMKEMYIFTGSTWKKELVQQF